MKNIILFSILLTVLSIGAAAQGVSESVKMKIGEGIDVNIGGEEENKDSGHSGGEGLRKHDNGLSMADSVIHVEVKKFPDVSRYDHALYQNVTKQDGFWKGIGKPLTATEASHLSCYYCLSRQIMPGKYVYMQAKNGYGKLTTDHSMGTYLANPFNSSDEGMDSKWRNLLLSVCQWEIVYDRNGSTEEDAYDAEGNLVYKYYPVNIGDRKIAGHFTNASGLPVNFRTNPNVKGVYIELDENGYESTIAFIDEEMHFLRNADDAFMVKLVRDRQGNIIRNMSCNMFGVPMIDNWGNCGWTGTYDQRGNLLTTTYINTDGSPMYMPVTDKHGDHEMSKVYTYDNYGRITSCTYYGPDMQPDTTSTGIHHWVLTYDTKGNRTSCHNYGLDKRTLAVSNDGVAKWVNRYDRDGNQTYNATYGKDGKLCGGLDYGDCINIRKYENGKRVLREDYNTTNGTDSVLNFRVINSSRADTTWMFETKKIEVETYDSRHRLVCDAYYDLNNNPINSPWHKRQNTYIDYPDSSTVITVWTDTVGRPMLVSDEWNDYDKQVVQTDSTTRTKITTTYRGDTLVERTGYEYDENYANTTAQLAFDAVGMRARSMTAVGLFYKAISLRNASGQAIAWRAENEFGEPAYAQFGDWERASRWVINPVSGSRVLDEHNDSITSEHNPWSHVAKAFYLEVISARAQQLGLRSGDIIMGYGDWQYPEPDSLYHRYYENHLVYETMSKANTRKNITVMRHNPAEGTSSLLSFELPPGTPQQLGFVYHIIYMTQQEKQRYVNTVKRFAMTAGLSRQNTVYDGDSEMWFFVPYKIGDRDDKMGFFDGLDENAVVLAWEPYVDGNPYFVSFTDGISLDKIMSDDNDSTAIYYTTDGRTVKHYTMKKEAYQYGRYSSTHDFPENETLVNMADSLATVLRQSYPDSAMRKPEEAMEALYMLHAGQRKSAENCAQVYLDKDYSIADYFAAREILGHIDWNDYFCFIDSTSVTYCLMNDTVATEVYTLGQLSIDQATGELHVPLNLIVAEVVGDGYMRQQGLEGRFLVLGKDDWVIGQDILAFAKGINDEADSLRTFTLAPLTTTPDGRMQLGKNLTLNVPVGSLGMQTSVCQVDGRLFLEVQKRAKKLQKAKKR